jgi:hypothetical protein
MRIRRKNEQRGFRHLLVYLLLFLAVLISSSNLRAQFPPEILSIHPGFNQWTDTLTAPVEITFLRNLPQISEENFLVFGDQTGLYPGLVRYDPETMRAAFFHDAPFKVGEQVTVILTSDVIPGHPGGFMWSFYPAPYQGTGISADSISIITDVARPISVAVGDFDQDGLIDLASADMNTDRITLFKGDCGSFTRAGSIQTNINPNRIITADINRDGLLDLITAHYLEQIITLHFNNGSGNFTGPQATVNVAPVNPIELFAVEFTGDGSLDLIVSGGSSVALIDNTRNGMLSLVDVLPEPPIGQGLETFGTSYLPTNVTVDVGDVDNDGYADFYLSVSTDSLVTKFEHGRLQPLFVQDVFSRIRLPDKPTQIELVDLQSDSFLDLVVATEGFPDQHLLTYGNDGLGSIRPVIQQDLGGLDLPIDLELFASNLDPEIDGAQPDFDILANHSVGDKILSFQNDNTGELSPQPDIQTGIEPQHLTGGDFDLDGAIDIVVPCSQDNAIWVFLSNRPPSWVLNIESNLLDFGNVAACDAETLSVWMTNENLFTLEIDSVYLETGSVFTLVSIFPHLNTLDPGDSIRVSVEYRPDSGDSDSDRIVILSKRCAVLAQYVDLRGEGTFPLELSPDSILYAVTAVGDTSEQVVTITNANSERDVGIHAFLENGLDVYTISVLPCGSNPTLELETDIPPGSTFEVCVSFHPSDQASYTDTLIIEPSEGGDCNFETRKIPLFGEGAINDPPFFVQVPDSLDVVFREGDQIFVDIFADDPELDLLDISYDSLQTELTLEDPPRIDNVISPCGERMACADLIWVAPFIPNNLEYTVIPLYFTVRETDSDERLFDTLRLPVTVRPLLPDLLIASLSVETAQERNVLNREIIVRSSITVVNRNITPSFPPFSFRLRTDAGEERLYTIETLDEGEIQSFQDSFRFGERGDHWIEAVIDVDDVINEDDEENNRQVVWVRVEPGELTVRHNPFTPNNDGYNDRVEFDLTELGLNDPRLFIFALDGRKIVTLSDMEGDRMYWNGKDEDGRDQRPGAYLFVLRDGDKGIESGTIGLVR